MNQEVAMPFDPNAIKAIFLTALEKATAAERSAYLDEACMGDAACRQRVEALLQAHDAEGSFLEEPLDDALPSGHGPGPIESSDERKASDPTADRNLLFGILALQMDFIRRDALIAAMNAWVLNKHRTLGDILLDQMALCRDARPPGGPRAAIAGHAWR